MALEILADLRLPCSSCAGARYRPEVLAVRWRGLSVAEFLARPAAALRELLPPGKLRTGLKSIRAAIDTGDTKAAQDALSKTFSLIDKMSAKKIIHDNAAGRYKSRLSKSLTKKTAAAKA